MLLAVLFCNSTSAQLRRTRRKPTPAEIAKLKKQYARDSIKNTFEHLELQDKVYRARIQSSIIRQGDSVQIKYVFKVGKVVRIAVEGGGTTTPKDIRNGVFVATIRPKKTMWVDVLVDLRHDITGEIYTNETGWRVIVVEPEKYDSIKAIYDKLPEGRPRYAFTDSLSGGTLRDFRLGKIK